MYLKLLTTDSATNTTNGILILIMLLICAAGIYCFYRLIKRSKLNKQYIEESGYEVTDELGDLKVDKNNSVWWVKNYFGEPIIHNFGEVIDYELVVNDNTVKGKGAFSRAVAGGLLFGGVGAVAGASTAKRVTVVTALYINVYLKDGTLERINFINTATKADSFTYNVMKDCAEKASALFTAIIADNESKNAAPAQAISAADEIAKYKKLLDDGAITEEEYNAVKKQAFESVTSGLTEYDTFFTKVAGVTHNGIQLILPKLKSGSPLCFVREADNPYDDNAIRVECNGRKIGYLRAELAADLAPIVDNGGTITGTIAKITGGDDASYGCNIEITVWTKL